MALVIGHSEVPLVLSTIVVTVAYEGSLPVVVKEGVRDGNVVCRMGDIKKAIIVILYGVVEFISIPSTGNAT